MKILIMFLVILLSPILCVGQEIEIPMVSSHSPMDMKMTVEWMGNLMELHQDSTNVLLDLRPAEFTSPGSDLQFFRNKMEVLQLLTASTTALLGTSLMCNDVPASTINLISTYKEIIEEDIIEAKIYAAVVKEHEHLVTTSVVVMSSVYSAFKEMEKSFKEQEELR